VDFGWRFIDKFSYIALWDAQTGQQTKTQSFWRLQDGSERVNYTYQTVLGEKVSIPPQEILDILARVNQATDTAFIRQVINQPDLKLTFQSISDLPNAAGRNAALYSDETGTKYYMDVDTGRLGEIVPNYPSHPEIPSAEAKSMVELHKLARQFAMLNSPRLAGLEASILYEEGCKGAICFFRWDYRNKDWSGTDWAMMPPLLQIGLLTNGQLATYINTLDLFK
jgi:hypothetical protein